MWNNFAFIFNIRDLNSRFPKSFIGQSHSIIGQKRIFPDIKEFCDDCIVMITNDYIVMTTFLRICTEIKVLFLCVRKHSYISISIKNHGVELSCFRRTVPEKNIKHLLQIFSELDIGLFRTGIFWTLNFPWSHFL